MSRALARAKIPLWYTEGFNPHPYMSFSLPLSLGIESYVESMDIRIVGEISNKEIKNRLNEMLPSGIRILDVYDDFRSDKEIAYSDYVFKIQFTDNEKALNRINEILNANEIPAERKVKKGKRKILKQTDLKPLINSFNSSIRGEEIVVNFRLAAGIEKNLNPTLLFDTLIKLTEMDFEWKSISRIAILDKDFKEFK